MRGGSTSAMEPSRRVRRELGLGGRRQGKLPLGTEHPTFQVPWLESAGHGASPCQGLGGRQA